MKSLTSIVLAACLLTLAARTYAQTSCPRVWQQGDTLWTDPADGYQWYRGTEAIQGANRQFYVPNATALRTRALPRRGPTASFMYPTTASPMPTAWKPSA